MRDGLPIVIAAAILAAGCREDSRLPSPAAPNELRQACCVFLRHEDGHVLGRGVFLSKVISGSHRVFCLTARHVVTEWEYDNVMRAPYKNPAGMRIAVFGNDGVEIKQMLIAPERWQCADLSHDIAWFELTDEEWTEMATSAVAVGEALREGVLKSEGGGLVGGTTAIRLKEYGSAGISYGSDLLMLLQEHKAELSDTLIGSGATTNVLATLHDAQPVPVRITFKRNFNLKELMTKQLVARAKVVSGDSGEPVFAMGCIGIESYPLLIGVVTGNKDDCDRQETPEACICPLDEALHFLGSMLAHRLVDFPEYQ